jgi:hypothetical protein
MPTADYEAKVENAFEMVKEFDDIHPRTPTCFEFTSGTRNSTG